MITGFTGPREGMNAIQKAWLISTFAELQPRELHHGACTGADTVAHLIAREHLPGCLIVAHPPVNKAFLSEHCIADADIVLSPKGYHERDHDIAGACDVLLSTPKGEPYPHSGTWLTINFALTLHKPVRLCYPDGTKGKL